MEQYSILTKIMGAIILLLYITGCTDESIIGGAIPTENNITVNMTIPGLGIPMLTRSGEDKIWERKIKEVDLMFFDNSEVSRLISHVHITNISQETYEDEHRAWFNLILADDPALSLTSVVAVIANAHDAVAKAWGYGSYNIEKKTFLQYLQFETSGRWNTTSKDYIPMPMYGEVYVNGIYKGVPIPDIEMKRMLARIDVQNKVNGSIFKLEKIHLANYRTSGFIAPAWNEHTGLVIGEWEHAYPYSRNMDPMVPAGFTTNPPIEYLYSQSENLPGSLMEGLIYTYEAPKAAPNEKVCLVLEGIYKGVRNYYRVDFTSDQEMHEDYEVFRGDDVPLYRNHKYVVTVTAAEGVGYPTFQEAINASSVLSNLKTTVHIVDMTGINHIVYDGQYFMGTEKKVVDIPWNASKGLRIKIISDYQGSWDAKILNSGGTGWLRFSHGNTIDSGENLSGLDISIATATPPVNGHYTTGQIVFSTGRLCDTLTIRRVTMAEMFAHSNIIAFRNEDNSDIIMTFATAEIDLVNISKNSQGLFFKWGSLYPTSPLANPYESPKYGNWGNIPYAHRSFNFTTPLTRKNDTDAFKTYNNNLGFKKEADIGDICRYISSQSYWGGGKWRLPTYEEWMLLHEETTTDHNIYKYGGFYNMTESANALSGMFPLGNFTQLSGFQLGIEAKEPVGDYNNPPAGGIILPASGDRYSNGIIENIGALGFYWSSTPCVFDNNETASCFSFGDTGVTFYDVDRSCAFPVRCIRDY